VSTRESGHDLKVLDARLRRAVESDRLALCAEQAKVQHRGPSVHPPYTGGYLTRGHLAALLHQKIMERSPWDAPELWSAQEIEDALRPNRRDRSLPALAEGRQLFLDALYRVMADCFRRAGGRMNGRDPVEYLDFLGGEQVFAGLSDFDFDPASIGFFPITEWNAERMLLEDVNVGDVQVARRERQDWVDAAVLSRYERSARGESGGTGSQCTTLLGFEVDTREAQGQRLVIRVGESWYYQNVAIGNLLKDNHSIYDGLVARITDNEAKNGGLAAVIAGGPHSNIALNVTVTSRSGRVLLVRRTKSVRTWKEYYQAGPHETMNFAPTSQYQENCFDLARRALWEELRIVDDDVVGNIVFSWFGYYLREAQGYFFAHVQTNLSENEIAGKARNAHSAFENGDIEWLDLTAANVAAVLATWSSGPWAPGADERGRRFLPHAAISLTQLYRVKQQRMFDVGQRGA